MKHINILTIIALLITICSCSKDGGSDIPKVKDPIKIESPSPVKSIEKVSLNSAQETYVRNGNSFAINTLKDIYETGKGSMVLSPLSLQYALAMAAAGASGETAEEIISALGCGDDIDELNGYCNLLLNQLPALDEKVTLKLTDAMIVNDEFTVSDYFRTTLEENYYAPVEYMDSSNPKKVVERINEWAYRSTDGFIYPFLQEDDLSDFAAVILNALYFKAPWQGTEKHPMFKSNWILRSTPFYTVGGKEISVDYLVNNAHYRYGRMGDNSIVGIPYAGGKYAFYAVLPDDTDGIGNLLSDITEEGLHEAIRTMTWSSIVRLRLPKFEIENKYDNLVDILKRQGISRAFDGRAQFDKMFEDNHSIIISNVIQKARIKITEWGTEAGAVSAVELTDGSNNSDGEKEEIVNFYADHPFAFFIEEMSSGVILFEGVYAGE